MANILIIDDYPNIDYLYRTYLEDSGHRVFIASSCDDAVDIVADHNIDVVVADQFIDGLNSEELIAILKLLRPKIRGILSMVRTLALNREKSRWDAAVYKGPDFFEKLAKKIGSVSGSCAGGYHPNRGPAHRETRGGEAKPSAQEVTSTGSNLEVSNE
jgi:CheY-like chemotaxis protein